MDRVRAADRLRARFAQPDEPDLAGVDKLAHRPDGFLDRSLGIDAVLVVEIDVVDTEAAQRRVARCFEVFGPAADRALHRILRIADDSELRSERDLGAPAGDRPAYELLARVWPGCI